MIFQNNTLQSGKEYTLSDLFSEKNKIIIPDLQRDYCWGDKAWDKKEEKYIELVSGFLKNLKESFDDNESIGKKLTLGLVYGYESPKNHIQLCDGQQRITTLFLILGVINRKTKNHFQKFLISNEEIKEDKAPYLQYSIRESTLYFLSDLVCKYFILPESEISFEQIKKSSWYFTEYDLDASIESMLSAIKTVEGEFDKYDDDFDFYAFGEFLTKDLQMLYYDMENRTRGEETFVIINTTGEPLSATENLKPTLIGKIADDSFRKTASDEWEEREEWFWLNRKEEEKTSDEGMNQFFIWYWQMRLLQERTWKNKKPYALNPRELFVKEPKQTNDEDEESPETDKWEESIKPATIHRYFEAFERLLDLSKDTKTAEILKTIKDKPISVAWFRDSDLHIILPLIAYLVKFPEPNYFYEYVRRIRKNHFDEKRKRGNFVDWRHIIQIIDYSESEKEIFVFKTKSNENFSFKNIPNVELKEWFTGDEQIKNDLKEKYKSEIECWEDHIDLMGDITPLLLANKGRDNSYENLENIYKTFELLYSCYNEEISNNNPILSNYVRLYRVLLEDNIRIAHIGRTSGMRGSRFSWNNSNDNDYLKYLTLLKFVSLFSIDEQNLLNEIKQRIKEIFPKENFVIQENSFAAEQHLKCWVFLKTLQAENLNILLSHKDGNGIASYSDFARNKLNKNITFSLGNSICGFGIKSGFGIESKIRYASDYWGQQHCFDTITGNSITKEEFENRENIPIPIEKIQKINYKIQSLIDDFYQG